jgi:SWI/SNF-related matrix-associated actin-dependent regulator 1 of chromatin subfamily A
MRDVFIDGDVIKIYFDHRNKERFNQLKDAVKKIDGRRFNNRRDDKHWSAPAGLMQCKQVVDLLAPLKFDIDPQIRKIALDDVRRRKAKTKEFDPADYDERLYPFQAQAVEFLNRTNGRALIADEMGLGKTVEALVWINQDKPRTLTTAPANVVYKWLNEVETWTGMTAGVIDGFSGEIPKTDVVLCSYAVMTRRWQELLGQFECLVFDECHYLKGRRSTHKHRGVKRVDAALELAVHVKHILGLSGTPFLNRPIELFNILQMLDPASFNDVFSFGYKYCGGEGPDGRFFQGATNTAELKDLLELVMIRRLKQEVLDQLPPLQRTYIPVDIHNLKEYWTELAEVLPKLRAGDKSNVGELARLRRILGEGKAPIAVDWAKNYLDQQDEDHKIVIYCHHHSVVNRIVEGLKDYGVLSITGKTPSSQRGNAVASFQTGPERVMVITSAGGEGIDLFGKNGKTCDTILFVERQWTPATEEQAEARLHRLGQSSSVGAYYLVANRTIDTDISRLIDRKRSVFKAIATLYDVDEHEDTNIIGELIASMGSAKS